jgi:hydrogenase maturation factor
MKTWSVLYGLIWASFAQIFLIVFLLSVVPSSGTEYDATIGLHIVIGIIVIALAAISSRLVRKSGCPDRIKRISRTTMILAGFQGVLGIILYALMQFYSSATTAQDVVLLLHVGTALAIISQASSSATAYDMWEEKEFLTASPSAQA